ncbi:glycosyltransferase [Candidatus Microgenomates bacterium]|nr:glycosyltransferase [Candidatus Microgenomates bacterium]
MIVIASHAVFNKDGSPVHGTGSEIETYLQDNNISYVFIKHPLYFGDNSIVEKYISGVVKHKNYGFKKIPFLLHRIQDYAINFIVFSKIDKKPSVFIGIDPFNGFFSVLSKKIGLVKNSVFYTADYAHKRFDNKALNWVYHWFDRFCIKNSDYVWNVSSKITDLRNKQGVEKVRNILLPNTPEFKKVKRFPVSEINIHDLVIVSNLTSSLNYELIFNTFKKLNKNFKKSRLLIIGEGGYKNSLKKMVKKLGLSKSVIFLGKKPHGEVLKILSKSAIGLAFYTNTNSWTEFGDSMKVREYLACGLPVVMNDIVSTAKDIEKYKAGFVVKDEDEEGLYDGLKKLMSNKKMYKETRENAVRLAEKFDFTKMFENEMNKLVK